MPTDDAPAVARLKAAGAIVFGKTNLPRWSGDVQTYNELFGVTNNPWDVRSHPRRIVGRRGGRGRRRVHELRARHRHRRLGAHPVALLRRLRPQAQLRRDPAARLPRSHVGGGTTDVDINVFGPIARSADDLDLLLGVLAGPEPERADAWQLELPARDARVAGRPPRRHVARRPRVADRIGVRGACCAPRPIARRRRRAGRRRSPAGRLRAATRAVRAHDRARDGAEPRPRPDRCAGRRVVGLAPRVAPRRRGARRAAAHVGRVVRRPRPAPAPGHDRRRVPARPRPRHVRAHDRDRRRAAVAGQHHRLARSHRHRRPALGGRARSAARPPGCRWACRSWRPYLHDRRAVRAAQLVAAALGGYEVPPGSEADF